MNSEHTTLPISELIEDTDLYPRHTIDGTNIQALAHALEAGATLPPIVADRKSKRITDGWHRRRAYKRVVGTAAVVNVELIEYPDEAAMKFDAAARNANHGRRLDMMDKTRCVMMLRAAGFGDEQIAGALHVPTSRVEKLSLRVAKAPDSAGQNAPGTKSLSLKRSVAHLAGTTLTKAQAKAHAILPGTSFLLVARQLCEALSNDMVNLEDTKLVLQLEELRNVLIAKLEGGAK